MPATPARIGFITNEFRRAIAGPDNGVAAAYGALARDTPEPVETFFEHVSDAQAMANERLALLAPRRRMFTAKSGDLQTALDTNWTSPDELPTVHLIDEERGADLDLLVVGVEMDFEGGQVSYRVWG